MDLITALLAIVGLGFMVSLLFALLVARFMSVGTRDEP